MAVLLDLNRGVPSVFKGRHSLATFSLNIIVDRMKIVPLTELDLLIPNLL